MMSGVFLRRYTITTTRLPHHTMWLRCTCLSTLPPAPKHNITKTLNCSTTLTTKEKYITAKQPQSRKDISISNIAKVGISAFTMLSTISYIHVSVFDSENALLLSSFGATCLILCMNPDAPIAQPRNIIGGHMIGATCGILAQDFTSYVQSTSECSGLTILPEIHYMVQTSLPMSLSGPLAVTAAAMLMMGTRTVHFPAGGTALGLALSPNLPYFSDSLNDYMLIGSELATLTHVLFTSSTLVVLAGILHRGSYPRRII
jgi:CBS-domain-containing membrane protein